MRSHSLLKYIEKFDFVYMEKRASPVGGISQEHCRDLSFIHSFHFYLFRHGSPISPRELLFRGHLGRTEPRQQCLERQHNEKAWYLSWLGLDSRVWTRVKFAKGNTMEKRGTFKSSPSWLIKIKWFPIGWYRFILQISMTFNCLRLLLLLLFYYYTLFIHEKSLQQKLKIYRHKI